MMNTETTRETCKASVLEDGRPGISDFPGTYALERQVQEAGETVPLQSLTDLFQEARFNLNYVQAAVDRLDQKAIELYPSAPATREGDALFNRQRQAIDAGVGLTRAREELGLAVDLRDELAWRVIGMPAATVADISAKVHVAKSIFEDLGDDLKEFFEHLLTDLETIARRRP